MITGQRLTKETNEGVVEDIPVMWPALGLFYFSFTNEKKTHPMWDILFMVISRREREKAERDGRGFLTVNCISSLALLSSV